MSTRTLRTRQPVSYKDSGAANGHQQQLSSPPPTPKQATKSARATSKSKATATPVKSEVNDQPSTPKTSVKQEKTSPKAKQDPDELPHGLGKRYRPKVSQITDNDDIQSPSKKVKSEPIDEQSMTPAKAQDAIVKDGKTQKKKKNKYGYVPGQTPYPDFARPSPEECSEVHRLLAESHGAADPPVTIPTGSLDVAGCGAVPHILDALIRTYLSSNTNRENANRSIQGIRKAFGTIKFGDGNETLNWNAVRDRPQKDLFEAIKNGGCGNIKSKNIKAMLDMVSEETEARRTALLSNEGKEVDGDKEEIMRTVKDVLSLDHYHLLTKDQALDKFTEYPGIGLKTAACVALFCLQRPCFAVDTHVWRICNWLGWVPHGADRDQSFCHLEVRIPDEHKYALHQLFFKHGRTCSKCQAKTNKNLQDESLGGECVLDHLVKRFKHKERPANGKTTKVKAKKPAKKPRKSKESDDDTTSSSASDYGK